MEIPLDETKSGTPAEPWLSRSGAWEGRLEYRSKETARGGELRHSTHVRSDDIQTRGGSMNRELASRRTSPGGRPIPGERFPPGHSRDSSDGCAAAGPGRAVFAHRPTQSLCETHDGAWCRIAPSSPGVGNRETEGPPRRHHPSWGRGWGQRRHPGETIGVRRGQTAEGRSSLSLLRWVVMTRECNGSDWQSHPIGKGLHRLKIVTLPPGCKIYLSLVDLRETIDWKVGGLTKMGGLAAMRAENRFQTSFLTGTPGGVGEMPKRLTPRAEEEG